MMLLGIYAFAFQIYLDFSGYTDMARGLGRMLGIELPINFDLPYLARGLREFWQRWHISLSTWLRDYLYIPLGGSRTTKWGTYRNLMITMLLGGLWHGASFNFVIWGGIHGALLALERSLGVRPAEDTTRLPLAGWLRWLLTFHLVCFAWIFFRADSFDLAMQVIGNLVYGSWSLATPNPYLVRLVIAFAILHEVARHWSFENFARTPVGVASGICAIAVAAAMMFSRVPSEFIYFQF